MIFFEADTEQELQNVLDELDASLGYPNDTTEKYGDIHLYKTKGGNPFVGCFLEHASYFDGFTQISWETDVDVPEDPFG